MEKKLYRLRTDRMIAGVASGLGRYFDVDPVLVRLFFVAAMLGGGAGFWIYIVLWIVIPEEPFESIVQTSPTPSVGESVTKEACDVPAPASPSIDTVPVQSKAATVSNANFWGIALLGIGSLLLLNNVLPGFDFDKLWPLLLIGVGFYILWSGKQRA